MRDCASSGCNAASTLRGKSELRTFFHPDCTVGPGVSPDHAPIRSLNFATSRSRALPPIGNERLRPLDAIRFHPAPKVFPGLAEVSADQGIRLFKL
jgi:hypothetical protein